ncbi:hypothetical protein ERO13_D02G166550v2 [Gossypium hirsutum]|nr:hypothetical protein ERO13_D02G166550v2 [Gossypium hirsutum]
MRLGKNEARLENGPGLGQNFFFPISPLPEIPSARLPSSIFFSIFTSGTDPPLVWHRSTSGPPRLHPFPPFPVSLLPQIPNPLPDCPPPFFSQPSPPAPIHLRSSTAPPISRIRDANLMRRPKGS